MKMPEARNMAKKYGINSFGKTKAVLIREIQRTQGFNDCFGTAGDYCEQLGCCFYTACVTKPKKKRTKKTTAKA